MHCLICAWKGLTAYTIEWLSCLFLFCRVKAYIENGWADDRLIDLDGTQGACISDTTTANDKKHAPPETGWINIRHAFKYPSEVPEFTNGQIVAYFVTRTVSDGKRAGDFKSINTSAVNLFRCGHIQMIHVTTDENLLWVKANCLPEMRKDRVYKVIVSLRKPGLEVISAQCGCPAGKGPNASCKHIAALCYALVNFYQCGKLPDFLVCTQKLQEWNRPRAKRVDLISVENLGARRQELVNPNLQRARPTPSQYDPRPLHLRHSFSAALERMRVTLLNLNQQCGLLTVLPVCVENIHHDHSYSLTTTEHGPAPTPSQQPLFVSESPYSPEEMTRLCKEAKATFSVTQVECVRVEATTRSQCKSTEWYLARVRRITASKCGKILNQKQWTPALLKNILYCKPMIHLPQSIQWGIANEDNARHAYITHMQAEGNTNLQVEPCGFIIHPTMGWLGASPDGVVNDPSNNPSLGIVEFKCLFTQRDNIPQEACTDPTFYCSLNNEGKMVLNRSHLYYHQVQLQLYVSAAHWCDFCIFTNPSNFN